MEDDIQAVYIQGVESWIKLPTGDVEQTIVELGPLVYAMKYLKLTNRVTEIIEQDGYDHVRKGRLTKFTMAKTKLLSNIVIIKFKTFRFCVELSYYFDD